MVEILICEDNPFDKLWLIRCLEELQSPQVPFIISTYTDGQQVAQLYQQGQGKADLVILDMLMDQLNGIETALKIREYETKNTEIVIVTATPQYALEGYKVNAHRYYLKPVNKEEFLADIKSLVTTIHRSHTSFLTINNAQGINKIKLDDIMVVESLTRTLTIGTQNQTYSCTGRISEMEEQLEGSSFIRVHKSFIVNLKYVANIFKDTITLDNGVVIPLSKHKSKQVHEVLMNYINQRL